MLEMASTNDSSKRVSEDKLYQEVFLSVFWQYFPVVVFLSISGVIGIIGNILTVKFYRQLKVTLTPFVFLVQALAWTDGLVSCLLLAGAVEIAIGIAFKYRYVCKMSYFFFEWTIYASVFILVLITVDRFKNICRPFGKRLTTNMAKRAIPVILVMTLATSIRNVFIYDVVSTNIAVNTGNESSFVTGYYCTNSEEPNLQPFIKAFHTFDVVVASIIFVLFTVTYSLILHTLFKHQKTVRTLEEDTVHRINDTSINKNLYIVHGKSTVDIHRQVTSVKLNQNRMELRIKKSEYKISMMMFLVTAVFLLSLAPFFVAVLLFRESADSEFALKPYTQLMMKSVFLNSVSNPVIYYVYNDKFRRYANKVLTCKCKEDQSTRDVGSESNRYSHRYTESLKF